MRKVQILVIVLVVYAITVVKSVSMTTATTITVNNNINYSTNANYSTIRPQNGISSQSNHSLDNGQSLWCPDQFQRKKISNAIMKVCTPKSCLDIENNENEKTNGPLFSDGSITITKISNVAIRLCRSFNPEFNACSKTTLSEDDYEILDNGTIWNKIHHSYLKLGEFYKDQNRLIVCQNDTTSVMSSNVELPQPCGVFEVFYKHFRIISSNQTLYVKNISKFIAPQYFYLTDNDTKAYVCDNLDPGFLKCRSSITIIGQEDMTILPNRDLWTSYVKVITYPFGSYAIAEDESFALVCVETMNIEWSFEAPFIYGSVATLSAVCLLIALLVYLFIPKCNYHTKAMLCLALSLFIMYTVIAIRSFNGRKGYDSIIINLTIFAIQYIFALGSFCWLSVLAFELWRVFSSFNAYALTSGKRKVCILFLFTV